jgi:hypothetical protein
MFSIVFYTHWGNIRLTNCFCGIAEIHVSIVFYTHWGNIRLMSCFCGIARIHVFYYVLHALGQHQNNEMLLWNRPNSCFLLCFYSIGAIPD